MPLSRRALLASLMAVPLRGAQGPEIGPARGSLVVVGGGRVPYSIGSRFVSLAGGLDAPFVVVPTADGAPRYTEAYLDRMFLRQLGCRQVRMLHTYSREEADTESFTASLREARGVWFVGGRQWRLVDSYLHTRTQRELQELLSRGGVIGGTSAGATILGSYLVRGAREGNTIMMAPGYEEGFGFLRRTAVDQHMLTRGRQYDLVAVLNAHPDLLGIALDEATAIVVQGDQVEVIGDSLVAVSHPHQAGPDGRPFDFYPPGTRFSLRH